MEPEKDGRLKQKRLSFILLQNQLTGSTGCRATNTEIPLKMGRGNARGMLGSQAGPRALPQSIRSCNSFDVLSAPALECLIK